MDTLDYLIRFTSLHTNMQHGISAPHKAILLISIIKYARIDKELYMLRIFGQKHGPL